MKKSHLDVLQLAQQGNLTIVWSELENSETRVVSDHCTPIKIAEDNTGEETYQIVH